MGKRILIAKHNDLLRVSMARILNLNGFNFVIQAHGVNDLLEKIEATAFDLVIIERSICKELGKDLGIKQIRKIKRENESIRFIIINPNGAIEENIKKKLMNTGVKAFIPNEAKPTLLIETINRVLSGQRVRKSGRKKTKHRN